MRLDDVARKQGMGRLLLVSKVRVASFMRVGIQCEEARGWAYPAWRRAATRGVALAARPARRVEQKRRAIMVAAGMGGRGVSCGLGHVPADKMAAGYSSTPAARTPTA